MYIAWSCSAESLQGCLVQVGNDIELDTIARSHHKGATGRVQTGKVIKLLRILAFYRRIHPLDALPLNLSSSWAPSLGAVQHLPGGLTCHPHTWCACLSMAQQVCLLFPTGSSLQYAFCKTLLSSVNCADKAAVTEAPHACSCWTSASGAWCQTSSKALLSYKLLLS